MSQDRALQQAIDAMNHRLIEAFISENFAALGQLYTEHAQVFVSGMPPIVGREAIAGVFAFMRQQVHGLELATKDLESDGATATEHGQYVHKNQSGDIIGRGQYLVVWKQIQGQWLIHRDMILSDLPAAG